MESKQSLDRDKLPGHIAIILDGNGRWAKKRNMPRFMGHRYGMDRVVETVESCVNIGIETLTLYAFSTENWKRPKEEVDGLMDLLIEYVNSQLAGLIENNVRVNILGDKSELPDKTKSAVDKVVDRTRQNSGMVLNIALNYGGRSEITRAVKKICQDEKEGIISLDDIDEDLIASYLYTSDQKDPDLLIRPGGEIRISNFLIYQMAYTEFYFSDTLWPDFDEDCLIEAIKAYQNRQRRYGGVK